VSGPGAGDVRPSNEDAAPHGSKPDLVPVVAAVVEREGRWLLGQRPAGKRHAGLWEFPGGKVRAGESEVDALCRELAEELEMTVTSGRSLFTARDGDSPFVITFVEVVTRGEPTAQEHTAVAWLGLEELSALELAPADAAFVRWLAERRR
jgi:8-oxo-dGTP diphosphatase